MRRIRCEDCGQDVPSADSFNVLGRNLCEPCADKAVVGRAPKDLPKGAVVRNSDPTICAQCGKDGGNFEWPHEATLGVCDACREQLYHRPFPTWVRLSFAAILLLVCIEVARNWRLFQAHVEIPRARRAIDEGRVADGAELLARAARHAPEMPELAQQASFFQGVSLLQEGRFAEAATALEPLSKSLTGEDAEVVASYLLVARVQDLIEQKRAGEAAVMATEFAARHPKNKVAPGLVHAARVAQAFDDKDYDGFLSLAQEQEAREPEDPLSAAQVASALACKYAVTGDEEYRRKSTAKLEQTRAAASGDKSFIEYEERILHRLNTREIIDRTEYNRRFRSGAKGDVPQ